MLSVHMITWITFTVSAFEFSLFSRAASIVCNSIFGTAVTFIGATRISPKTKASSVYYLPVEVVTRARNNATALKISWELSPNICNSILSKAPVK